MDESHIKELLKMKGDFLYHREGQELEFKEQFNLAGLADYFRDFAAFANNRGGYLIFGVKDSPRIPNGMNINSISQFNNIDPEKITGYLLEIFSADIRWEQTIIELYGKQFGVFKIEECTNKPIIAKKDEGKDHTIKNGEIYYRYGGRTQKIQYAELESIIRKRIEANNLAWMDLVSKIGKAGPENAAILDTERGLIEKNDAQVLVMDDQLASKISFIKEGEFVEKNGEKTLKLIGDVYPVEQIEVTKRVKENLVKTYPLSATDLVSHIKKRRPDVAQNQIWEIIKENNIKSNSDYSAYNFRNKRQEDEYIKSQIVHKNIPSIYNLKAVDFILKLLEHN
ncbi:Divergent AAA domain protein [Legionella massiliensis]|uniref:Divergent AAA domain protein n=1 Tax=Legionella massiliensis TaxID=1034943 RepID=A0A078KY54_9GAMM|nr:ATP-binding protein [Legionella massiliensis]CDZ76709.1 Divergent AAA domain protein [Legionella massiliensis]CEE12447.1 Divergent AAA domain protein [Legionella massiliensis]